MAIEQLPGIYDWAMHEGPVSPTRLPSLIPENIAVVDETFRDGKQGMQTEEHPPIEQEQEYLLRAAQEGYIHQADIGFPASGPEHREKIAQIVNYVDRNRIDLLLSVAGRAGVEGDISDILRVSEWTGHPLKADLFIDVSKIRATVQGWDRREMLRKMAANIEFAKREGLQVMFVPERSSVTPPQELHEGISMAIDSGADRICVADTTGELEPQGTSNLFRWIFDEVGNSNPNLKFEFHEHNDFGMGTANCLVAVREGVDAIHATGGGVGERTGNVRLETIVGVLTQKNLLKANTRSLQEFAQYTARMLKLRISPFEPFIGELSTSTSSGIHSDEYAKSKRGQHRNLYLPFDPEEFGLVEVIGIGPTSGISNVRAFCERVGIEDVSEEKAIEVLNYAKSHWGLLSDATVMRILGKNPNAIMQQMPLGS